jgi:hypothetical protein
MIRPLPVVLALAGLLAACGDGADVTGGPAPPQTPYRFGTIRMGHWGIGPIREATYFEQPAVQALFPRAKVRDVTLRISDDETRDGISVVQDGTQLLEIDDGLGNYPGADNDPMIGEVRATGGPIKGPSGETLGMSWNAAKFDLSQCEVGVDRDRNTVICARQGEGAVTFQFAVPGWDSEEMPPEQLMRSAAFLKTIIWTPPPLPGMPTQAPSDDQ